MTQTQSLNCYHADTDVMTTRGWINIQDVKLSDVVATLNINTNDVEWQPVSQKHDYRYDGTIYNIQHHGSRQMITPNHYALVEVDGFTDLVKSCDLSKRFSIPTTSNPVDMIDSFPHDRPFRIGSKLIKDTKHLFKLIGMFLGDGYSSRYHNQNYWGFGVKKQRKVDEIRRLLNVLNINYTETRDDDGGYAFVSYDRDYFSFFEPLGKATNKYIPLSMFNYPPSVLIELFHGMMETDGNVYKNTRRFFSTSKRLVDTFQVLCFRLGLMSTVKVWRDDGEMEIMGRTCQTKRLYVCHISNKKKVHFKRDSHIEKIPYTGTVHCVGVDKNHTIFTRFEGRTAWSGNSYNSNINSNDGMTPRKVDDETQS